MNPIGLCAVILIGIVGESGVLIAVSMVKGYRNYFIITRLFDRFK